MFTSSQKSHTLAVIPSYLKESCREACKIYFLPNGKSKSLFMSTAGVFILSKTHYFLDIIFSKLSLFMASRIRLVCLFI